MRNGEVVEMGNHEDLMTKKGLYYQLVNNQIFVDTEEEPGRVILVIIDGNGPQLQDDSADSHRLSVLMELHTNLYACYRLLRQKR